MMRSGASYTTAELAELLGARLLGSGDVEVTSVASLDHTSPGSMVRADDARRLTAALKSSAAAVLTAESDTLTEADRPILAVPQVRLSFAHLLRLFALEDELDPGIHPTAVIEEDAVIEEGARIGPLAVIGKRCRVGEGARIHARCVVMHDSVVGAGSCLYPGVVLYPRSLLGAGVRIHAGSVIGADGFGYEPTPEGLVKVPQTGRVVLGDDVEIGALSAVDRATMGDTVIGRGTKLDNLVQVGHNVVMGQECRVVAHVGIGGSCRIGSRVVIAGKAGLKDHVEVGDDAMVLGGAEVWRRVPPGQLVSGKPARPHDEEKRTQAMVRRLPRLMARVTEIERRLALLTGDSLPVEPADSDETE